jgi:hypothetical protein
MISFCTGENSDPMHGSSAAAIGQCTAACLSVVSSAESSVKGDYYTLCAIIEQW